MYFWLFRQERWEICGDVVDDTAEIAELKVGRFIGTAFEFRNLQHKYTLIVDIDECLAEILPIKVSHQREEVEIEKFNVIVDM